MTMNFLFVISTPETFWLAFPVALFVCLLVGIILARKLTGRQQPAVSLHEESPRPVLDPDSIFLESDFTQKSCAASADVGCQHDIDACSRCCVRPNFRRTFLHNNTPQPRASIYVSAETKRLLGRIAQHLDEGGVSMTAYVDNILRHHLETYKEEVNRIYQEQQLHNII